MSSLSKIEVNNHLRFLGHELKLQTEEFKQKLQKEALTMLEEGEIFIGQYLKEKNGQLILKFYTGRPVPRRRDFLLGALVKVPWTNYKTWQNSSWGEVLQQRYNDSELQCIWQSGSDDPDFILAGFNRASEEFFESLEPGCIVLLGPQKPPLDYLKNLYRFEAKAPSLYRGDCYFDFQGQVNDWKPAPLDNSKDVSDFVLSQLYLSDKLIIQGPPGTGKTYLIAQLCKKLAGEGKSVLVTALTNRALMEVSAKSPLDILLITGNVFKRNLSLDEHGEQPLLLNIKSFGPIPGSVVLSTFYATSFCVGEVALPEFDVVIVDEASQTFLSTIRLAEALGRKLLIIGDQAQLPPITITTDDDIKYQEWDWFVKGFGTYCSYASFPAYMMQYTRRLNGRAAKRTSAFYPEELYSLNEKALPLSSRELSAVFDHEGGPSLVRLKMEKGKKSERAKQLLFAVLGEIGQSYDLNKVKVAVLSTFADTVSDLQKAVTRYKDIEDKVYIDTVARVQGYTCDICIFLVPNYAMTFSLDPHLFNVATSRARSHTLIIAPDTLEISSISSKAVRDYLTPLINSKNSGLLYLQEGTEF